MPSCLSTLFAVKSARRIIAAMITAAMARIKIITLLIGALTSARSISDSSAQVLSKPAAGYSREHRVAVIVGYHLLIGYPEIASSAPSVFTLP